MAELLQDAARDEAVAATLPSGLKIRPELHRDLCMKLAGRVCQACDPPHHASGFVPSHGKDLQAPPDAVRVEWKGWNITLLSTRILHRPDDMLVDILATDAAQIHIPAQTDPKQHILFTGLQGGRRAAPWEAALVRQLYPQELPRQTPHHSPTCGFIIVTFKSLRNRVFILAYTSHRFLQVPGPDGVRARPSAANVEAATAALLAGSDRVVHLNTAGSVLLNEAESLGPFAAERARAVWDRCVEAGLIPPRVDPVARVSTGPALIVPVPAEDSDSD